MRDCLFLARCSHARSLQVRRFLLRSRNSGSSLVPACALVPIASLLGLVLVLGRRLCISPRACPHTQPRRLNASPTSAAEMHVERPLHCLKTNNGPTPCRPGRSRYRTSAVPVPCTPYPWLMSTLLSLGRFMSDP